MARAPASRLAPALWGAAAVLTALLGFSDGWDIAAVREVIGAVILVTAAAIAATACWAVRRTHDGSVKLLLDALLEECPTPEPGRSQECRLRRVG